MGVSHVGRKTGFLDYIVFVRGLLLFSYSEDHTFSSLIALYEYVKALVINGRTGG